MDEFNHIVFKWVCLYEILTRLNKYTYLQIGHAIAIGIGSIMKNGEQERQIMHYVCIMKLFPTTIDQYSIKIILDACILSKRVTLDIYLTPTTYLKIKGCNKS